MKTLLIALCGVLLTATAAAAPLGYLKELHETAKHCNRIETERVEKINTQILELLAEEWEGGDLTCTK